MPLRTRPAFTNLGIRGNTTANIKSKTASGLGGSQMRSALGEIGNNVNPLRGTAQIHVAEKPILQQQHQQQQQDSHNNIVNQKKMGITTLVSKGAENKNNKQQQHHHHTATTTATAGILNNRKIQHLNKNVPTEQHVEAAAPIQQNVKISEQLIDKIENVSFSSDLLVEDIDIDDAGNPILVSIYSNDIYEHLRKLEKESSIDPDFLKGQQVTPRMRGVLVDWLVEVHQQFHLTQETLYLTVALSDRFLQAYKSIDRKRLQLVGITAMFLASKYEEMYSPDLNDFVYITDNTYTKSDVLQMEMLMLKTLNFAMGRPLPLQFLRRYSKAGKAMAVHHTMAKYFLEQSLIHYEMCHYPPSLIAAAALYLALYIIGTEDGEEDEKKSVWTPTLAHYSTYKEDKLFSVAQKIASIITTSEQCRHQAVRKKYTQSKHMKISLRSELKSPTMINIAKADKTET